jgi:hypothetical protein
MGMMAALIRTQLVDDELAIDLGAFVLVASKTEPGGWYEVRPGHCTCAGFEHRGTCRHLQVADKARMVPCHICGSPARPSEFVSLSLCGACSRTIAYPAD